MIVIPLTSDLTSFTGPIRPAVRPSAGNGLDVASQMMIDHITTIRREKISKVIGRLEPLVLEEVEHVLVKLLGLDPVVPTPCRQLA